ncbi:Methyltransferase-like protein 5 [Aphelenchoides bicaudatus]|nr:Methyltransferase-like protein 5 [Aphelenchoides bicaudatus]
MKRKHFVWQLESLQSFEDPKLHLEQYSTSAEMTAEMVEAVDREESLSGKTVGDFGCGPGILMIGASLMGAAKCRGFEIDESTAEICRQNIQEMEIEDTCTVEIKDVLNNFELPADEHFDIILMNPPFGTKNNEGVDLRFVQAGLQVLKLNGSIYSLHKTSTRGGIMRKAATWSNVTANIVAELRWELPKTYKHQRKQTQDIAVDLIRYKKSS